MSRIPVIAGNWKMFKTGQEAKQFAGSVKEKLSDISNVEMVICAPFTALEAVIAEFAGSNIGVGAQNMHYAEEGAFTGEIASRMLNALGVKYVIIGHSERRAYFGETDETVNLKVRAAFQHGLIPIVCVGENLTERESNQTFQIVENQTQAAVKGVSPEDVKRVILAYEPIWAIGTGKTATSSDANEVCAHIRQTIGKQFTGEVAQAIRIQYGGSVKPDNIASIVAEEHIDGALVGGASLDPSSYVELIRETVKGVSAK